MAKTRDTRPAIDPVSREKQLTNLAYDLAERQLKDGSASPSVIGHFLKLATQREKLELEILEKNKVLTDAKTESLTKDRDTAMLAKAAIEAMGKYRSSEGP